MPFTSQDVGTPNRGTSELSLDQWNQAFRASPVYQQFMASRGLPTDGRVTLSPRQQSELEAALRAQGFTIPSGMHIDQGGNLNQKNRLGRNVAIGAGLAGAALTGFGLAGMGPLSGLGAGAGAGLGTGEFALTTTPFAGTGAVGLPAAAAAGTGAAGAAGAGALAAGGAATGLYGAPAFATQGIGFTAAPAAGAGGVTTLGNLAKILNSPGFSTVAGLGTNLLTNYMANRAQSGASADALAFQREALDRTEALQKEMNAQQQANWEKTMALAQQQYEAEQARRAPYRAASGAALQWLQNNYSQPTSAPYAYNPTITYKG